MPDSSSLPIVEEQTLTLSEVFAIVVTWFNGLSDSTPTIHSDLFIGVMLTFLGGIGWLLVTILRRLFAREKDPAVPPINIHPQIIVEVPKTKESVVEETPETSEIPETPKTKINSDRLPTVKGEFFGRID